MSAYIRRWFSSELAPDPTPQITTSSPSNSDDEDDGEATETERDYDDTPPAFPALNSAQRMKSSSTTPAPPQRATASKDSALMPPPPVPGRTLTPKAKQPMIPQLGTTSSSLLPPPTTTQRPQNPSKKREKVALSPGHSPLDWARLRASGADLRGVDTLRRIPPSELKQHRAKDDAWSSFNGKVYNITHYLPFHPGGERELMRVAGRDGTKLFAETHAWVSIDGMLEECLVGVLVPESS